MNTEIKELRKTFEKGDVKVTVEWHVSEIGDISYYGEYTSDGSADYVVDRESGFLLGDHVPEPDVYDYLPDEYADVNEYDIPDEVWDEAEAEWDEAYDEWADTPQREVLATGLSTMNRHEYRYFVPERLNSQREWGDIRYVKPYWDIARSKSQFKKYDIDTGDKRVDLSVLYACQDYERVESLNRGDWCYMGCVVKVEVSGVEIGYSSCWGIESDSGDDYLESVEREEIGEALKSSAQNIDLIAATKLELSELETQEVIEGLEN